MLPEHRYGLSSCRAACKQWSAGLGVLILLTGALAGLNPTKMLWAAGPLLLLGLVEAGYAAQERRYAELLKANPSTSSGQAPSAGSGQGVLPPEPPGASVARTTLAALSLSIWPFYLGLFAIVEIGGEQMAASNKKVLVSNGPANFAPAGIVRPVAANAGGPGCGSAGCGSTGGCGNGGCGASAGKGCTTCSVNLTTAEAAAYGTSGPMGNGRATTSQLKRPVQQYVPANGVPIGYQGGYQQMPQGQMLPQAQVLAPPGQTMPQPAQYQRLPNGAIVNARPPGTAMNPALMRTLPAAGPGQPVAAASVPGTAASAVIDAPLQNAVPAQSVPAAATPAPGPISKPATPDAASKKKH